MEDFKLELSSFFQKRTLNLIWVKADYPNQIFINDQNKNRKSMNDIFIEMCGSGSAVIIAWMDDSFSTIHYKAKDQFEKTPQIIGLQGKMGAGKDTFALFLTQFAKKYDIRRFSYGLRVAISIFTKIPIENTWSDNEKKQLLDLTFTKNELTKVVREMVLAVMEDDKERNWCLLTEELYSILVAHANYNEIVNIHFQLTLGKLLQLVANEFFRHIDENCFVDYLDRHWNHKTPLIITDVRYPNEMKWVKINHGKIVSIVRGESEQRADGRNPLHYSECALIGIKTDFIIENRTSLLELEQKALKLLEDDSFY